MGEQLSNYLADTTELLRDTSFLFTTRDRMIRWINQARKQVALQTGCIRLLVPGQSPFGAGAQPGSFIPGAAQPGMLPGSAPNATQSSTTNSFNTIPGVEMYPFSFANSYMQAQYEGVQSIIDVIEISVSWGGERPVMNWLPWEDLQAYARSYNIGVFSYPFYWSTNGDGENAQLWMFPGPTTVAEMEWDVFAVPKEIYADSDYDAIPSPFSNAVKYYAAHLAYMTSRQWGSATLMLEHFKENIGISRVASDRGKTPSFYWQDSLP